MKELKSFLKSQKVLVLGTVDEKGNPWQTNVYFSVDKDMNLFFVSPTDTKHCKDLLKNPKVSFSVVWYDKNDLANRKGVQGVGTCKQLKSPSRSIAFLKNHAKFYPLWRDVITYDNMKNKVIKSRPFVIEPEFIKYWDDDLYGAEGTKEFSFK